MCLALREVHRDVLELPADGGLMARIGSPLLVLSQPMWHCTHHAVRPTHFSKAFRALQVQGDHQRPVGCREMTAHPCCLGQRELSSLGSPITDPSCPSEEGWGGSPHCSGSWPRVRCCFHWEPIPAAQRDGAPFSIPPTQFVPPPQHLFLCLVTDCVSGVCLHLTCEILVCRYRILFTWRLALSRCSLNAY